MASVSHPVCVTSPLNTEWIPLTPHRLSYCEPVAPGRALMLVDCPQLGGIPLQSHHAWKANQGIIIKPNPVRPNLVTPYGKFQYPPQHLTNTEWLATLSQRPYFQDINKSKPQTKSHHTYTYLTSKQTPASRCSTTLQGMVTCVCNTRFGKAERLEDHKSKLAWATQWNQSKLKQTKDKWFVKLFKMAFCVWATNVRKRATTGKSCRVQAGLCSPRQVTPIHPLTEWHSL